MAKFMDLTTRCTQILSAVEALCFAAGIALCATYALARADAAIASAHDLAEFDARVRAPDQSLWSPKRVSSYRAALTLQTDPPVAILSIPALKLEVPVYDRATELTLNRGAALIDGMMMPDQGGNAGIAGHRDGYFRVLKDVRRGDLIEVRTRLKVHRYRVVAIQIVDQEDAQLLRDTDEPAVTLVTCYPFYYVGSAPQRFIVTATYEWSPPGST
jgi:sortase A